MNGTRVVDICRGEVGVTESPANSNRVKYWDVYPQWNGSYWCAAFTTWSWRQVGVDLLRELGEGSFYVPSIVNWAKWKGIWKTDEANDGDLVVYGFGGSVAQHIGIAWPDPYTRDYRAIEGNTSPGDGGSQANGGGVYRRYRKRSHILGWVDMATVASWYAPKPESESEPEQPEPEQPEPEQQQPEEIPLKPEDIVNAFLDSQDFHSGKQPTGAEEEGHR